MLMLRLYLNDVLYTVPCRQIREIAPMATFKKIPHAPDFFAGFFNCRGTIVPAIDLCRLLEGHPCRRRLSTRMILVDYVKDGSVPSVFALIADRVTEILRTRPENFIKPGIHAPASDFLGNFILDDDKMIPCIDVVKLADSIDLLHTLEDENRHAADEH